MKKKIYLCFILIIIFILLDQLSKLLIIDSFNVNDKLILIDNFLKFYYIKNTGISFGILNNQRFIIIILTLFIIMYVVYDTIKSSKSNIRLFCSSLIIGGALGNLIDRVFRGYVIDFISFTLFKKEMAIFNMADIFITIGIFIYIYILIMEGKNERNSSR